MHTPAGFGPPLACTAEALTALHCFRKSRSEQAFAHFAMLTGRMPWHDCSVPNAIACCVMQVKPAYQLLDAFHHGQVESHTSVTKIMADSEYLRECQDLFELYVSDYIMLTRSKVCIVDLSMPSCHLQ